MTKLLWIGLAGGAGSLLRYAVSGACQDLVARTRLASFPLGTVVVNVLGSALIGFLWVALADRVPPEWRTAALVGLLGGFTTYSTFSLETVQLLSDRQWGVALLYIVVTNVGAIAAAAGGLRVAQQIYGGGT